MFIIFGAPRSGTTLLSSSLNLNDSIVIPQETDFIVPMSFVCRSVKDKTVGRALIGQLITSGERFPHSIGEFLTAQEVIEAVHGCAYNFYVILETLYGRIAQKAGKTLAGDKSPNDLFFVKRVIGPRGFLRSGIRIIHLVRDVRAVIVSHKKVEWAPQGIENYFARSWSEANLYLHNYLKNSPNYLFMKFEEMVCDPERTFRIVTDFLGVPFQEKMFDSDRRWARHNGTMHHENLQYDFMPEKSNAWKEEIDLSLLRRVEKQANEALETFGYERRPWPGAICSTLPGNKVNGDSHPKKNRAICILGMHRSGTSVITHAVNLLGPYIGKSEHLMKPVEGDNPHGFWELWSIFSFHEKLLSFLSRSWDNTLPPPEGWWKRPEIFPYRNELKGIIQEEFGGQQLWLWKDPRTSLLLPLWKDVMQELDIEVNYLICLRSPLDVAASLARRNNFPKNKSFALWLLYNVSALFWTNGANRVIVHFDDFIENWESSLKRISSSLHIPWPEDEEGLRKSMTDFLRPEDRHYSSETELLLEDKDAAGPVVQLYPLLLRAIKEDGAVHTGRFFGEVESLYREYYDYAKMGSSQSGGAGSLVSPGQDGKISHGDNAVAEGNPPQTHSDPGRRKGCLIRHRIEQLVFPQSSSPAASIIIPVWNQWEYTYHCLQAILSNTHQVEYEVIIVDNGSSDKTVELLAKTENIRIIRNQSNAGYVLACNQGADVARGEYLVFLNNDTQPLKGWLGGLVETAQSDETVGAVGAKLIYPDGLLQEAGGLIFSDGRGWNFGKRDDPNEEIYNVMCEVDYCSAACLLVKKELFAQIGGFDSRYVPAYYEDSDLCFSLRQKGYRVIYNPDVCIIHHESVTAGTDESRGYRRYLAINRQKFIEKWRDELLHQDPSPSTLDESPVTSCRERLIRKYVSQDDVIYGLDGEKAALRKHPSSLRIDKSVMYETIAAKERKTADVVTNAVRRYGPENVGIAWSGGKDSAALLHIIRQAFGGRIPVKVISVLAAEDSAEKKLFIEKLRVEYEFDLHVVDEERFCPPRLVPADYGEHLTSFPETLLRAAVEKFHLLALITAEIWDGKGSESLRVYFAHENDPRYVRVRPMLHFRETDVWYYIKRHDVPLCESGLYRTRA